MNSYSYKVTCDYRYYGYPQAERRYTVTTPYVTIKLRWYGNQGFDCPEVQGKSKCNGYFWYLNAFLRCLYSRDYALNSLLTGMAEGRTQDITIEDGKVKEDK